MVDQITISRVIVSSRDGSNSYHYTISDSKKSLIVDSGEGEKIFNQLLELTGSIVKK